MTEKTQNTQESVKFSSKPHILVIDDDKPIRELLTKYLVKNGMIVAATKDTETADNILEHFTFDIMVVDVMMPKENGMEFTQRIRSAQNNTPVILLTALGESSDRIAGLESGADDYLPKPFEPKELLLRIQSVLRRSIPQFPSENSEYKIGIWTYIPNKSEIRTDQEKEKLTAMEERIINQLLKTPNDAVDRYELAKTCGLDPDGRAIDVQITRLRKKLRDTGKYPETLITIRGKGYKLIVDNI